MIYINCYNEQYGAFNRNIERKQGDMKAMEQTISAFASKQKERLRATDGVRLSNTGPTEPSKPISKNISQWLYGLAFSISPLLVLFIFNSFNERQNFIAAVVAQAAFSYVIVSGSITAMNDLRSDFPNNDNNMREHFSKLYTFLIIFGITAFIAKSMFEPAVNYEYHEFVFRATVGGAALFVILITLRWLQYKL